MSQPSVIENMGKTVAGEHHKIIALWTRFWGMHQLVRFANMLTGITAGAIDNWPLQEPLTWWHWHIRLPLVLASIVWPSSTLALVAHLCNLVFLTVTMPLVWDHMCWASLHEIAFLVAMLAGSPAADFLSAGRVQTLISYISAAFWKVNTSFLDPRYSCGTLLVAELLSIVPGPMFHPHTAASNLTLRAAPAITIVTEFTIPLLLAVQPHLGVLMGLFFHLTILMLPVNAAGGFALTCAQSYFFFVPRGLLLVWDIIKKSVVASGCFAALLAVLFATMRGTQDATFLIYLLFSLLLLSAIVLERRCPAETQGDPSGAWRAHVVALVALLSVSHGFAGPILGVQHMASLTMYGNVKHWGGSNHLLVPTAVLQDLFADMPAKTPFFGAFAGGNVRVDAFDLAPRLLRTPAEATKLVPDAVRSLVHGVGNLGLFYVPYYARMAANDFFDDVDSGVDWKGLPFAAPAFELRRLLALARREGASFTLRYTVLPKEARSPAQWMLHDGPQVVVHEDARSGVSSCTVEGQPCASDELALLPPPPSWLAMLLLPYPIPLLQSSDTELLCVV